MSVFLAAPFVAPLLRRFGPASMIFWGLVASVGVFIALPAYVDVYVWFALRLVLGIALSFLWIAGEAWVCHIAEQRSLGRTVAVYATVISIGFALGPALLAWIGTEGWAPFSCAARPHGGRACRWPGSGAAHRVSRAGLPPACCASWRSRRS